MYQKIRVATDCNFVGFKHSILFSYYVPTNFRLFCSALEGNSQFKKNVFLTTTVFFSIIVTVEKYSSYIF